MQRLKLGILAALIGLLIVLTFQNAEPIEINVLFFSISASGGVLLFIIFLLGVFAGMLLAGRILRPKSTDESESTG